MQAKNKVNVKAEKQAAFVTKQIEEEKAKEAKERELAMLEETKEPSKKKRGKEKNEEVLVDRTVLNEAYPEINYVKPEDLVGLEDKNLNIVVIGHVDSGKSTLTGHLLYKLGHVSNTELRKHQKSTEEYGKAGF